MATVHPGDDYNISIVVKQPQHPLAMNISLFEVMAWATQSMNTAEREGFVRVAAAVRREIERLTAMRDAGVQYVTITPVS